MKSVLEEQPDITLEEIKERMNLTISVPAICRTAHTKLGFNYKKTAHAAERDTEKNKEKRDNRQASQRGLATVRI